MTLRWNQRALDDALTGAQAEAELMDRGWEIALQAARRAPKDSGRGAASIHPELVRTPDGPEVRVSWDRSQFHMAFPELGTERQPATPFLRPAAQQFD